MLKLFLSGITCLVPSMTWVKLKLETILRRSSKFQSFFFNTKCQKLIKRSKVDLNQSGNIKCRMIVICIIYVPRKIKKNQIYPLNIARFNRATLRTRKAKRGAPTMGAGGRMGYLQLLHTTQFTCMWLYVTVCDCVVKTENVQNLNMLKA